MFFAAIHFPPSPFVRRFAGLKFLPAFARMSVPKSMHMSAPMSLKIFAPRFALKSAAAFLPKFAKTSSQSFSQMFIPALVRRSAQHFAPAAGRSLPRCRKFLPARRPQAFSLNRCNRALSPSPRNPWRPLPRLTPTQPQLAPGSSAISNQKIVRVQPGDSLWRLAQQNLGRGNRWPELLAANRRIANPNRIRAGARLYLPATLAIPPATRNAASSTVGRSASTVKVRKGDTLWSLARSTLGRSSYWPCLASANPSISDPNRIYENQDLLIPTGCSP